MGKLHIAPQATAAATHASADKAQSHPLYGKHIVMTGFRDKALAEKLAAVGAEQGSAVKKNTFFVLVKEQSKTETTKTLEAKALGIPLLTADECRLKYNL